MEINDIRKKMFIKLYYSLLDWAWISDPNTLVVFIHLLLNANRKDQPFHKGIIRKGQVLASYEFLAKQSGLSVHQVRRAIDNMIYTGDISRKVIGKYCVYTLNCWSLMEESYVDYNFFDYDEIDERQDLKNGKTAEYSQTESISNEHHGNETATSRQDCGNETAVETQHDGTEKSTPIYCNNEDNEIMKECESVRAHALGKFSNVFISHDESEQFRKDFPHTADEIIDELSEKIATGDRKYQTGHLGHLYIFARNYKGKPKPQNSPSYDINLALSKAKKLDPTKTKRNN